MRSYQLHEFEYEMLADHIGGPECHEVWRLQPRGDCDDLGCHSPLSSHCQTLLSATAAKKVVHKRRSGEISNSCQSTEQLSVN